MSVVRRCLLSIISISLSMDVVQLLGSSGNVEGVAAAGNWGLPDSVAVVGRIFHYQLPSHDTVCGNLTNYQVNVAGKEDGGVLPSWLTFNKTGSVLEGVPAPNVNGQTHNIQVMASCTGSEDDSTIPIKQYFTIRVSDKEDTTQKVFQLKSLEGNTVTSGDDVMLVRCEIDGSVTTATVTIDADESLLTAGERVTLLRRLSSHLVLPETLVRLLPFQERPVFDDSALVAGPGDTKRPTAGGVAVVVEWDVGCGNVYGDHMPALELLEVTSNNGTMRKAIGYGVVGWHITSKRSNQRRLKRRVYLVNPTATPTPSVVRPTARPVPTKSISDTDAPEVRIVPTTRTSASAPWMTRTLPPVSPSRSKDASDRITKGPSPTTTYVTITPTRVYSTKTGPEFSTVTSSVSVTKNTTSSRSADDIEPSIVTEPTVQPRSTDVLPTWTTSVPGEPDRAPFTVAPTAVTPSMTPSKLPTSRVTKRTSRTPKPSTPKSPPQTNRSLTVSKELELIEVFVGNRISFRIPDDTFSDEGGVEDLVLILLQDDITVPPSNWINLNETTRTLYGLALDEHIGTHQYQLAAVGTQQQMVRTPCIVEVQRSPASLNPSNEFSVTLDLEYENVKYNREALMNLIDKIASAFGDSDASKMTILRISPGSVVITYTNNTLPLEPCPQREIEALLRYLLQPDGRINETFAKAMEPYRVINAEGKFTGSCASLAVSTSSSAVQLVTSPARITVTTTTMANDVDVKARLQKSDNLLLYILLPLLLFFLLLLLVIVVCVVCYRRQRRRQKEEDKLTGLHKGIPIIFADELDDKQETPVSTLKSRGSPDEDGRQSVPPPEYPSSKPGSRSSTLRSDYKSPLISDDEDGESAYPETLPRKPGRGKKEGASTTTTPLLHYKD